MPVLQFAEWRPDVANLNSSYTDNILNVLCADGSYLPFPKLSVVTGALGEEPLGAFMARDLSGQITIFAGTTDKLWALNNTDLDWDDVSQAATTYSATSDARWDFGQFGNFVIAVNQNDDPQVFELGTDTEFRDLGGSPPRAGRVRVWGDFVALMQLTSNPDRVQWSGLNDCEFWTPGSQNSDYQDFPDGGVVQNSTSATNPLIFLERAIWRGTFVPGSVEIFTFNKIHDQRGAKSALSVAARGSYAFYADEGGFFQIGADGSLLPIGFEKVDRTVFGTLAGPDVSRISGVVDPFYSRVYWAVDYGGTGRYDTLIIYDWNLKRWSQAEAPIYLHMPAATTGYTLEGLDAISASLDDLPFSLDSKAWQGGAPLLAAFDEQLRLGFYSGAPAEATIYTSEQGDTGGAVTTVRSAYAMVDTDQLRISIGSRFRRTDPVSWTIEGEPSSNTGRIHKKSRARFHRMKVRVLEDAEWTHAQGVDVDVFQSGFR